MISNVPLLLSMMMTNEILISISSKSLINCSQWNDIAPHFLFIPKKCKIQLTFEFKLMIMLLHISAH